MPRIHVAASATIAAPPEVVYAILADYREGHPRILPPQYFRNLTVEQGGRGAGTHIRFDMRVLGRTRTAYGVVTEPEPGRVLVETYPDTGIVTTFIVEPRGEGRHAAVTIASDWEKPGLAGWFEQKTAPPLLRRIFEEELRYLARYAAEGRHGHTG